MKKLFFLNLKNVPEFADKDAKYGIKKNPDRFRYASSSDQVALLFAKAYVAKHYDTSYRARHITETKIYLMPYIEEIPTEPNKSDDGSFVQGDLF